MSGEAKTSGIKSAYELALERLESQGIERPREASLTEETKLAIAQARRVTESKLAELEILHRDQLVRLAEPAAREEAEANYLRDRRRIEADGERTVARLRDAESEETPE